MASYADVLVRRTTQWLVSRDPLGVSLLLVLDHAFCPHSALVPAEKRLQDVSPAVYTYASEGTKLIEENSVEYLTYLAVERNVAAA
jgi:hypothetical protein